MLQVFLNLLPVAPRKFSAENPTLYKHLQQRNGSNNKQNGTHTHELLYTKVQEQQLLIKLPN